MTIVSQQILWNVYGFTYDGLNSFYPYKQLVRESVILVSPENGDTILDLGCGTGNVLEEIAKNAPNSKLFGIDISVTMLSRAKKKLSNYPNSSSFHCADVNEFMEKQTKGKFDKIISVNVIYAIQNREMLWQNIARSLKRGGKLVIATSTKTGSGSIIKEHLAHSSFIQLLNPRLIGVAIIDMIIDRFAKEGKFPFPDENILRKELLKAGLTMSNTKLAYGGVDIIFTAQKTT